MKKNLTVIVVLLAVGLFFLLGVSLGKYASSAFAAQTPNAACAVTMEKVIAGAKGDVYNMANFSDFVEPKSYNLVTYSVEGDEITNPVFDPIPSELEDEQKNRILQEEAWRFFTELIPPENRRMVAQYIVFTDNGGNTLAAVDQTINDPAQWIIEVDIADLENKNELLFTLIHEYAHLLTLNDSQVTIDQEIYNDPFNLELLESKATACPTYFTDTDCSLPNSYINAFYNRFWTNINTEWKTIDDLRHADNLTPYYAGLYNFYLTHQNQFVDDYATTHPTEDIAESFTYFVFSPKPKETSIRDQKILFFYAYPELINLRQSILQGACPTVQ